MRMLGDLELHVDVPRGRLRVRADLMGAIHQRAGLLVVDQRGGELELGRQAELTRRTPEEVHARRDVRALEVLRREPDVLYPEAHRAVEARRVAGGEQLLRIGAGPAVAPHFAGAGELQV